MAQLSIFLREQNVPGEDDLVGPQLGTVLHAWRMGWNLASRKESCGRWPSFWCATACSRPRLLSGSWLGGAGLALPRKGVGGGLVYPDGVLDDRSRLEEPCHRTLHVLRWPVSSVVISDRVLEEVGQDGDVLLLHLSWL